MARFTQAFRSLKHRNYMLFVLGQSPSLAGLWMQGVAQSWLVYRLTGSATLIGTVQFAASLPFLVLGLAGGVLADKYDRKRLLGITQVLLMLQALVFAVLTMGHWITPSQIILLALFAGIINAFDFPARQAFTADIVPQPDLMNAISLNSFNFNLARIIGPAVAGIVIYRLGEGSCFLLNAVSFLFIIAALSKIRVVNEYKPDNSKSFFGSSGEIIRYVWNDKCMRSLLLLVCVASFSAYPFYMVLMPVFAKDVLMGNARTLGVLLSAMGVGAMAGALTLASRENTDGICKIVKWGSAGLGVSLMAFSFSRYLPLSMLLMCCAGFAMMVHLSATNTLLQSSVPPNLRGRLMSIYSIALIGLTPFGSLLAGWLADNIGATWTLSFGGACLMAGTLWYSKQKESAQ